MPDGTVELKKTDTELKSKTTTKTVDKKVYTYAIYTPILKIPAQRSEKQLLSSWNPKRKARLKERVIYHYQRAATKNLQSDVVSVDDLINRFMFFQNKCAYCQTPRRKLQIDHFYPLSKKGSHTLLNLFPSCRQCNLAKSNSDPLVWYRHHPAYTCNQFSKIKKALVEEKPFSCTDINNKVELEKVKRYDNTRKRNSSRPKKTVRTVSHRQ